MEQSQFSERLRQAMARRISSRQTLSAWAAERGEKLGKSQLSQYVSGKVTPRREALGTLAGLLGVPAEWLAASRTSLRPSLVSKFKFILRGSAP